MDWKHCVVWIVFSGLLLLTLDFDIKHIHLTANTPTPPVLNTQIRTNLEANVSDLPVLNSQVRRGRMVRCQRWQSGSIASAPHDVSTQITG
jgi:hypothetical protein